MATTQLPSEPCPDNFTEGMKSIIELADEVQTLISRLGSLAGAVEDALDKIAVPNSKEERMECDGRAIDLLALHTMVAKKAGEAGERIETIARQLAR